MINKFKLMLEGVPYEIERKGELILVNGLEFPWSANGNGLSISGNPHTVDVQITTATVDGIAYVIEAQGLDEPKPNKSRKVASVSAAEAAGAITAIMPGLIIQVNKQEGDRVEIGEVVIVLEAMKMQNELQAKRAGVVKQIRVKRGETVEMRQVLAVIE
jgi:biotin carboxyl carrier protein